MAPLIADFVSDDLRIERQDSSLDFEAYKNFLLQETYWKEYCSVKKHYNKLIESDYEYGVPAMNLVFYNLYKALKAPPEHKVFMAEYKSHFVIPSGTPGIYRFNDGIYKHCCYNVTMPEIERKLFLGYMSFLKEGYVMHWYWENGFPNAYYDYEMDNKGADICIEHPNKHLYCQRIYCKSDKSEAKAAEKDRSRLKLPEEAVSIKFEIEVFNKPYKLGDTCVSPEPIMRGIASLIQHGCERDMHVVSSQKVDLLNMRP